MFNPAVFAFVTGTHFAVMQFGYWMFLQLNSASTYWTWLAVTLAWMAGSVAGLWARKLSALRGIAAGSLSYFLICGLLTVAPFSGISFRLALAGVFVSGIWAGRFFVAALGRFKGPDRIFFHENNGFVFGLIAGFAGFTLGGRGFLLYAPALLTALALVTRGKEADLTTPVS